MSAVGLTWEVDAWRPALSRALSRRAEDLGVQVADLSAEERDEAVHASLDVLPVPVLQFPWTPEDGLGLDLGWVGESLDRLEAAGRIRRVDCADRRMFMRVGGLPRRQEQER